MRRLFFCFFLCVFIASAVFAYLLFHGSFFVNINGISVDVRDVEDYESIVENGMDHSVFTGDGSDLFNECVSCNLTRGYEFHVSDIGHSVSIPYEYVYDRNGISDIVERINVNAVRSSDAYIVNGAVVPEVYGNEVDHDMLMEAVGLSVPINIADYYVRPDVVSCDLDLYVSFYEDYKKWHVRYSDFGICVTPSENSITISRDGDVAAVSSLFIDDYIDRICEAYDTVGISRSFVTHDGSEIMVSGGTFGNTVDREAEKEALKQLFFSKVSEDHRIPVYEKDMTDIGDTYVEVSISDQHVWHYVSGNLCCESDCVTGCVSTKHDTPKGVWYIDMYQPGKMLYPRGSTSGTWVDRWMRFTPDGAGLHDASWRSQFGGRIYEHSGSHGCVNLPKAYAYSLYPEVALGVPVVVY